jgi:putative membrane protein
MALAASPLLGHTGVDHVLIATLALTVVVVYGLAWLRDPGGDGWRLWSWVGGIALLVLASSPWIERIAEESFTGHMVQHLLTIALAAPLLVLARPVHTVAATRWMPVLPAGRRLGATWRRAAVLIGPLAFVIVLFATHLTSIYDRALHDRLVHELEHAAYLIGAVLTWAALLGAGRSASAARVGAAFGVGVGGALLGMILLSASEPLVPTYEAQLGAARALTDQRTAAALMWIGGMVTTVPLLVIAVWRWASTEERIARRSEALGQP